MTRKEALNLVQEKIKTKNLVKHCLAVEAVMRALAKHFADPSTSSISSGSPRGTRGATGLGASDEEKWGLTGLLHDIDYEETKNKPNEHSLVGGEFLAKMGLDSEIIEAIKAHNEIHGLPRETRLAKALFSTDPITGLIVAAVLVLPSKKIADLTAENVLNRYKEKSFAKGANREIIAACSEIGLSLEKFVKISLEAMQGVGDELGL